MRIEVQTDEPTLLRDRIMVGITRDLPSIKDWVLSESRDMLTLAESSDLHDKGFWAMAVDESSRKLRFDYRWAKDGFDSLIMLEYQLQLARMLLRMFPGHVRSIEILPKMDHWPK